MTWGEIAFLTIYSNPLIWEYKLKINVVCTRKTLKPTPKVEALSTDLVNELKLTNPLPKLQSQNIMHGLPVYLDFYRID